MCCADGVLVCLCAVFRVGVVQCSQTWCNVLSTCVYVRYLFNMATLTLTFYMDAFSKTIKITGSGDQKIKIWDMHTGACTDTLLAHTSPVWAVQFDKNKIGTFTYLFAVKMKFL